jgi:hypothetical protein
MCIRYNVNTFIELPDLNLFHGSCRKILIIEACYAVDLRIVCIQDRELFLIRIKLLRSLLRSLIGLRLWFETLENFSRRLARTRGHRKCLFYYIVYNQGLVDPTWDQFRWVTKFKQPCNGTGMITKFSDNLELSLLLLMRRLDITNDQPVVLIGAAQS